MHTFQVDANPARIAPSKPLEKPTQAHTQLSGGVRLLLFEDEDMVRAVAERALPRAGYTVTSASDGVERLEIVQGGGEFDLIASNVAVPATDGPTMIREVRKLRPATPVLFVSGYCERQLSDQIGIADVPFLPEPFSVQQISDKFGAVLAGVR